MHLYPRYSNIALTHPSKNKLNQTRLQLLKEVDTVYTSVSIKAHLQSTIVSSTRRVCSMHSPSLKQLKQYTIINKSSANVELRYKESLVCEKVKRTKAKSMDLTGHTFLAPTNSNLQDRIKAVVYLSKLSESLMCHHI